MTDNTHFVNLHVHTEFSLLDGAIPIKRLLQKTNRLGMDSVAITDHGNIFGAVQLFEKAADFDVRPVLGCELYVAPGNRQERTPSGDGQPNAYHLVLLVMNETGYKNLCRLVTLGHLEGFYYHPRVDMDLLKEFNEGLIALSACLKGVVPYFIRSGRVEHAKEKAKELSNIFDKERFYLEVQANKMPEQVEVNRVLREFSQDLSIPIVATNDCHYLNREDSEAHDALLCIQTGKIIDDPQRLKFSSDEFYFKSREEMEASFGGDNFSDALDNTVDVARRCQYVMEFGNYKYPVFNVPDQLDLNALLEQEAKKGLEERLAQRERENGELSQKLIEEYRARLDFELDVITGMGFSGYFLIVADFIGYARRSDIPVGPGRGSAAGSLVAYSLRITNLDPIEYGLLFERFLNPQRISMPDIDIDFCIYGREEVIKYVADKYGRDNVGQIITFGTMKARGVIRDVGRVLNIPYGDVDKIAKLVPEGPGVTLGRAIEEEPELKNLENGEKIEKKLIKISRSLEGIARHASIHASGVVISDLPLVEYLPLYKGAKDEIMTQFTMDQIEHIGLIKFDFLGLKTLTVIKQALKLIKESSGREIDIESIPLDDGKTFKLCQEGKTTGVFQLESGGMKDLLRRLKPEQFEDLVALVALYRPGPMEWIPDYIDGKHGRRKPKYLHPKLEPILGVTYGVAIYQEQVMQIARDLAGFSMAEADVLRKAMGKKKVALLAEQKEKFTKGCMENDISKELAEKIFAFIEPFAGYGFNRSHAACYALIGYQTAYLKAHFPVQFMAALMTQDMGNQDKTIKNIAECRKMGISILPPDLNESQADFAVVDEAIRFGMAAVKNVGLKAVESIIEVRDSSGPFKNMMDFAERVEGSKVNRRVFEGLIQAGAFDFMGIHRSQFFASLDDVIRSCGASRDPNQLNMFSSVNDAGSGLSGLFEFPDIEEWNEREKLRKEKEALGFYITGHPLDEFSEEVKRFTTCSIQEILGLKDKSQVKVAGVIENLRLRRTKKGDRMAVFNLEDSTGATEVVLFPDAFNNYSQLLRGEEPLLVGGTAEVNDSSSKIIGKEIDSLGVMRQKAIRMIELGLHEERVSRDLLEEVRDILFRYPGKCSVMIRLYVGNGKEIIIAAHNHYKVFPCAEMIEEIEEVTGQKVVCRYGDWNSDQGRS
ncbi:MAG: DNA polymerase III subunit alpha [Deltaproteobacteria bacterium]|nr:DNA polymerase III subunit alpha [Deltaproteobacteria bacterium]